MITARPNIEEQPVVWWDSDPAVRVRADFPLSAAHGTVSTAVVVFELEPGCKLGRHTDSAEEVLMIVNGTVCVTVGDEEGVVSEGEMAVVPAQVPHSVTNIGEATAKVVGFFSSGHVVAEFDEPYEPIGQRVFEF